MQVEQARYGRIASRATCRLTDCIDHFSFSLALLLKHGTHTLDELAVLHMLQAHHLIEELSRHHLMEYSKRTLTTSKR